MIQQSHSRAYIWRKTWFERYTCIENPMDRGAWQAAFHGVAKSQTQLNDFTVSPQQTTSLVASEEVVWVVQPGVSQSGV